MARATDENLDVPDLAVIRTPDLAQRQVLSALDRSAQPKSAACFLLAGGPIAGVLSSSAVAVAGAPWPWVLLCVLAPPVATSGFALLSLVLSAKSVIRAEQHRHDEALLVEEHRHQEIKLALRAAQSQAIKLDGTQILVAIRGSSDR